MTQPILTNPQELETWIDEFMAEQMDELGVRPRYMLKRATSHLNH